MTRKRTTQHQLLTAIKSKLLRKRYDKEGISEEEFKEALDAGERSGAIDKTEHELIRSILEFTDTTAKEIMVPRPDIVALEIGMSSEKIVERVLEEGYSRLPVYEDDLDNIKGVVYSKDLLNVLLYRNLIILQDVLRKPTFVPESKKISQVLRDFQMNKVHLAIVVDEFGGTSGIITMEDIVEEIVGEIHDEYDEVSKSVETARDGSSVIDAAMTIYDFNTQFHTAVPEAPDYETIAGYLQKVTGKFPDVNEEIVQDGVKFTILSKSARRIRQVRVLPVESEPS